MLQSMGSQRVGYNSVTEQQKTSHLDYSLPVLHTDRYND